MTSASDFLVVQRLSQYRPFERGGASAREAQEDLVLAALAEREAPCGSLDDCQSDIAGLFGITLDRMEVARAVRDLNEQGLVTTEGRIELTSDERARLENTAQDSKAIEDAAMAEWHRELITRWPGLTDEDTQRLSEELDIYLRTVLRRHGAEAALLLYPDDPRAAALFAKVEEEGFGFLPKAPEHITQVREAAYSELLRRPTPSQERFLARMLNTAYFLTILSIDAEGAELVREIAAGQRVYLDTNFIFRVLGIQGPRFVPPAQIILRRTQEVGYTCAVTPWTVAEFQASLRRSREYLSRHPVPPSEYAAIAADAASEDDFVTAYWRKVKDEPGLRPEDFIALYSELEPHLSELDISLESEGCAAVEDHEQGEVDQDIGLLERALKEHGGIRGETRLRHDARHRRLILRLRGGSHRTFSNAGYWFLTHDSLLPRYDFIARGGRSPDPPFCVSAGAWFQVIEAFRAKSKDLDQAFADLLASPYVRYRRQLSKDSAQAVAARLALYKDATPELAASLFMNSFLMQEIEETESSDAKIEKIDDAIVEAAKKAQEDARVAVERAAQAQEQARATQAETEARLARVLEERERALADARERQERAVADERERRERAVTEERERAESRRRELAADHEAQVQQRDDRLSVQESELTTIKHWIKLGGLICLLSGAFVGASLVLGVDTAWIYVVGVGAVISIVAALDQLLARWGGTGS